MINESGLALAGGWVMTPSGMGSRDFGQGVFTQALKHASIGVNRGETSEEMGEGSPAAGPELGH